MFDPVPVLPDTAAPLSAHIRHADPGQQDDGRSDLSLALTAEQGGQDFGVVLDVLRAKYVPGEQGTPHPLSVMTRHLRRAQRLTRERLAQRLESAVLAGQGHEDRCLRLVLSAEHAALVRPVGGKARTGQTCYGLSHAKALVAWATQHTIPVRVTEAELDRLRARPGGTLRLWREGQGAWRWSVVGGIDPDRDAALADVRPEMDEQVLGVLLLAAARHQLSVRVQEAGMELLLAPPHDEGLAGRVRAALNFGTRLDKESRHPERSHTAPHEQRQHY